MPRACWRRSIALRERLPINAQAVRTGLALVELPGRFQIVPGQPALVLDVAHNPQAVAVLARNLDAMGFFPRTHAVFGAMRDKDIAGLLARMAPLVDVWHCCDLPTARAATAALAARTGGAAAAAWAASPHPPSSGRRKPWPQRRPARARPIESWSSAPSTPWAVC
jgi:dihydrofolate synthase/folylpolyglutamate synthase